MRNPRLLLIALCIAACSSTSGTQSAQQAAFVGDTVTMSNTPGFLFAQDSLTAVDGTALPCCTDSAGRIISGSLLFNDATSYADSIAGPNQYIPRACDQTVPNGTHISINNVWTLADGSSYLDISCSAGYFTLVLTTQLNASTEQDTVFTGPYAWKPDTLIARSNAVHATASMSGSTITVTTGGHQYQFLALAHP